MIDAVAPEKKDSVVKAKQMEALKRLGHKELDLDEYERTSPSLLLQFIKLTDGTIGKVANEVIHPDDIKVTFTGVQT